MFGSFLPSLLVGSHHQAYSGPGADIVMESITLRTRFSGLIFGLFLSYLRGSESKERRIEQTK